MPSQSQSPPPKFHYVVAHDGHADDNVTEVFGPFYEQPEAQAYSIDLSNDNGWTGIDVINVTEEEAKSRATNDIRDPYRK